MQTEAKCATRRGLLRLEIVSSFHTSIGTDRLACGFRLPFLRFFDQPVSLLVLYLGIFDVIVHRFITALLRPSLTPITYLVFIFFIPGATLDMKLARQFLSRCCSQARTG